ncbi:septum formation family protein [Arthrobacter sp. B1805]|uniref:septum formation family protein n=1 Tax=Arthrobacter sp. B1805 TaxID=2058892 RepID=UPI000CE4F804|nr:septum formation family protein [Arthrobacter sp. B1805]
MSNEEQVPGGPGQGPAQEPGQGPGQERGQETRQEISQEPAQDVPTVVDPDDVVLDDGEVSAESLEPELSVSPDTLDLAEPALEPAQISSDTAEAASLEDAAAEARAVAAEAEKTGTLVGGPMPADAPVVEAAPDGTAPPGGPAGDTDQDADTGTQTDLDTAAAAPFDGEPENTGDERSVTPELDADASREEMPDTGGGSGDAMEEGATSGTRTRPGASEEELDQSAQDNHEGHEGQEADHEGQGLETDHDADGPVGGPYAFSPEGGEPGLGHPGLYPGTDPGAVGRTGSSAVSPSPAPDADIDGPRSWIPSASGVDQETDGHPKRDRTRTKSSNLPLLLVLGGAVVLVGLLIWLLVSLFGGSGDEGRVDPSSLAAGECLADFTDITEDAVLVDCTEPHNAQLLASESYPDAAEFPGRDQLGLRAEAACAAASADINPEVVVDELDVTLLRATPTAETWADGDRRVDCFAVIENGGTVSQSLLNP